jgi:hypothetical protein
MESPDDLVVTSRTIQQKFAPHMHDLWMRSRMRPWRGVPRAIDEVWRLHQRGYLVTCVLWNHPAGLELRLTVDCDLEPGGNRCHSGAEFVPLVELALEWKAQFVEKGWRA